MTDNKKEDFHPIVIDEESEDDKFLKNAPQLVNFNSNKAGLDGLDKEKINKIIQEASKGSNFFSFQQKRQRRINTQIHNFKEKVNSLKQSEKENALIKADSLVEVFEKERVLNRIIVHFDMDMFFAAVELREKPELANKPMAVGSMSMISTSNYIARKFGVRSAMAGFIAKKLCPQLELIKPNFKKYATESQIVMNILSEYDPNMRSFSLDEVSLDLSDYVFDQYSSEKNIPVSDIYELPELPEDVWTYAYEAVDKIRKRVYDETQLTISAGISCNILLAKVSTDINKPNGQFMVKGNRDEILEFVSNVEIRKFSGIGPVKSQILQALNICTGKDLFDERGLLFNLFTEFVAITYLRISMGIGLANLDGDESAQKSHSREKTVGEISDLSNITTMLNEISERLAKDLKSNDQLCRTITLKLKKVTFEVFLKSKTIHSFTDDSEVIFQTAKVLLMQEFSKAPKACYRLVGLKLSNLKEKNGSEPNQEKNQLTLTQIMKNISANQSTFPIEEKQGPNEEKEKKETNDLDYRCPLCDLQFEDSFLLERHKLFCDSDSEDDLDTPPQDSVSTLIPATLPVNNNQVRLDLPSTSASFNQSVDDATLYLTCPICHLNSVFKDNAELNFHLDTCLNKQMCIDLTKIPVKDSLSTTITEIKPATEKSNSKCKKQKVNQPLVHKPIEQYFH